jgi:peroxiredoxin
MSRKWMSPIVLAVLLGLVWLLRGQGFPDQAPAVPVPLLDGGRLDFSQPQGQVRLVNFWSTSCAPCIRGMPALADTHHRYQARGLDVVAVAMSYDAPSQVQAFTRREALPFRVGFDPVGEVARGFGGVNATPTTYLIDRQGHVVRKIIGIPDHAALDALIENLLDAPS